MELKNKLQLPVIGAPLFIVSNPKLVIEQCKAGIVGSFPALNARPKELLDDWLFEIKEELNKIQLLAKGGKESVDEVNIFYDSVYFVC